MNNYSRRHFLRQALKLSAASLGFSLLFRAGKVFAMDRFFREMENIEPSRGFTPAYVKLHQTGELKARGQVLWDMMRQCNLCPRECHTNRLRGRRGDCRASSALEISSAHPHYGEETELVGSKGSGTIFFTNCSLHCVFCINYQISHLGQGNRYSIRELSDMMLMLQNTGCHNLNLVTPTHYLPHILLALDDAATRGLRLPVVYNTCGWEKTEMLAFLDGVVDVYLADYKYDDSRAAAKYSVGAGSYPDITRRALLEMQRQVGLAQPDHNTGLINRGLMIRHLVMPNNVSRSDLVIKWIAANLPRDTYLNIMSQYTPTFRAGEFPEIARRITVAEYQQAVAVARSAGLTNLRLQMQ